jgi:hypothetical protein
MRHSSVRVLVIAAFSFLFTASALAGLEGKWKIKVEPDEEAAKAHEKHFDDIIVFKADKFWSEAQKKKGFGDAVYEEDTRRFGPSTFTAEVKSDKEGKAKWTGTATAADIKGELTWTKKDGTELHFTYVGEKQN